MNADSHLIHVLSGHAAVRVVRDQHTLSAGSILALPPFTEFQFLSITPVLEMINIHYHLQTQDGTSVDALLRLPHCIRAPNPERLVQRLRELVAVHTRPKGAHAAALAHALVLQHVHAFPLIPAQPQQSDQRMLGLCQALADPQRHRFDARALARLCHLSVSQMNRRFRTRFGTSPHQYWDDQRFRRVRTALQTLDAQTGLDDLSRRFGFADAAYLSRWFRRRTGLPPLTYKRRVLGAAMHV